MVEFGLCDIDKQNCYPKGAICRLNRAAGFQTNTDYTNPGKKNPFRNKKCCHYKHNAEALSELEASLKSLIKTPGH